MQKQAPLPSKEGGGGLPAGGHLEEGPGGELHHRGGKGGRTVGEERIYDVDLVWDLGGGIWLRG